MAGGSLQIVKATIRGLGGESRSSFKRYNIWLRAARFDQLKASRGKGNHAD